MGKVERCLCLLVISDRQNGTHNCEECADNESLQIDVQLKNGTMSLFVRDCLGVAGELRRKVRLRGFVIPALVLNNAIHYRNL